MKNTFENLKNLLLNPDIIDELWESDDLIWIDWREDDEDIINYFNKRIGNLIAIDFVKNNKEYGDDIKLKYKDKEVVIPYGAEMDRDITIKYVNEIIKEDFEIRWFLESLGSDTLAFCILSNSLWADLEKEFGKETVDYYFMQIDLDSVMFNLDIDSVFNLISVRKENDKVPLQNW